MASHTFFSVSWAMFFYLSHAAVNSWSKHLLKSHVPCIMAPCLPTVIVFLKKLDSQILLWKHYTPFPSFKRFFSGNSHYFETPEKLTVKIKPRKIQRQTISVVTINAMSIQWPVTSVSSKYKNKQDRPWSPCTIVTHLLLETWDEMRFP